MATVPSYVKLDGYKGRSGPALPDGRLVWVTTEAEIASEPGQDLASLEVRLRDYGAGGRPVELEAMALETDPRSPNRAWEDAGDTRATIDGVRFDETRQELVVQLRLLRN